LEIEGVISSGWHINSSHPSAAYLIPTRVGLVNAAGYKVGKVSYPKAQKVSLAFEPGQVMSVYTGRVAFTIPITPTGDVGTSANAALTVQIDYQACNERECLRPNSVLRSFPVALLQFASTSQRVYRDDSGIKGTGNLLTDVFLRHSYTLVFLVTLIGGLA